MTHYPDIAPALNENAAGCHRRRIPNVSYDDCNQQAASADPDIDRLLDGVEMCRSVTIYAMRGWFDAVVDLSVARAKGHGWDQDDAVRNAVSALRETLHATIDVAADLKLAAGAEGRIQ